MDKRVSQLELTEKVYIDKDSKKILRKQKRIQKKSMAEIVIALIAEKYGG